MGTKSVEKGITRYDIEQQGTFGYMMRISREGKHYNEFYSDKKYKGKRKALAAARKRYQELTKKLPPPKTTKGVHTKRNKSGVVGVHLAVCESVYGERYASFCASWKTDGGERGKVSFSFKKYGKKKAWELACLARELEVTERKKIEKVHETRKKAGKKFPSVPRGGTDELKGTRKVTKKKAGKKTVAKRGGAKKKITRKR